MFTWNFQYISKRKLKETFEQLKVREETGDILVRIHTSMHNAEEAVDLAGFIKELIPGCHIFGTSSSETIYWGKLMKDQCVISLTLADRGSIRTGMVDAFGEDGSPRSPGDILKDTGNIVSSDTKLLLTFSSSRYRFIGDYVDRSNDVFPGVLMTGGVAARSPIIRGAGGQYGFVFDENGWSDRAFITAAFSGHDLECQCSFVSGAEAGGADLQVTKAFGPVILEINGREASEVLLEECGEDIRDNREISELLPFVLKSGETIPVVLFYYTDKSIDELYSPGELGISEVFGDGENVDISEKRDLVVATHSIPEGTVLRRSFIYDRKIISDNKGLYRWAENFDKDETIIAFSCFTRNNIYPNSVKWELSAYENTNICGCITDGEISSFEGKNVYLNTSFTLTALGENSYPQGYNPYAFYQAERLVDDNSVLQEYIMKEEDMMVSEENGIPNGLRRFVSDCSKKIFDVGDEDIPNASAMNMDIDTKGYDRMCIINVLENSDMPVVFSDHMIEKTYHHYINKCLAFAKQKKYRMYVVDKWKIAIGQPSFMVTLRKFTDDMRQLQKELFDHSDEYISIVPIFCVINGCTVSNLNMRYYTARAEMEKRNERFHVSDATLTTGTDEEAIRHRYHMVNVINYAITNNKVIPYYQGIYDNHENRIHHFESLMRLQDEAGNIYNPGNFLDVARSYGILYDLISRQMINCVFDRFENECGISVSINLGIRDIKNSETSDLIFDRLMRVRDPGCFVFEILENEDIEDYDDMVSFVDRIHEFGGKISIDDFGSGFSNLRHITGIHSDYVKIDGSLVRECCENKETENLIALIADWKRLNDKKIEIVAEFVENEGIQDIMIKYGIDYSQGYYFSVPSRKLVM